MCRGGGGAHSRTQCHTHGAHGAPPPPPQPKDAVRVGFEDLLDIVLRKPLRSHMLARSQARACPCPPPCSKGGRVGRRRGVGWWRLGWAVVPETISPRCSFDRKGNGVEREVGSLCFALGCCARAQSRARSAAPSMVYARASPRSEASRWAKRRFHTQTGRQLPHKLVFVTPVGEVRTARPVSVWLFARIHVHLGVRACVYAWFVCVPVFCMSVRVCGVHACDFGLCYLMCVTVCVQRCVPVEMIPTPGFSRRAPCSCLLRTSRVLVPALWFGFAASRLR